MILSGYTDGRVSGLSGLKSSPLSSQSGLRASCGRAVENCLRSERSISPGTWQRYFATARLSPAARSVGPAASGAITTTARPKTADPNRESMVDEYRCASTRQSDGAARLLPTLIPRSFGIGGSGTKTASSLGVVMQAAIARRSKSPTNPCRLSSENPQPEWEPKGPDHIRLAFYSPARLMPVV